VRVGFRRLFWIGAAALLAAAALVSIVALVRGEFTDADGKILGTLAVALLAGSTALAGLALVERDELVGLGWAVVATAGGCFAILTWQVWTGFDSESWSLDSIVVLPAALMVATARLMLRDPRLSWLFWTSTGLTAATAAVYVWAIHADPQGENWAKALGTIGIVTALAWFLVPVLGRIRSAAGASERVVGRGPGRVEVELADGETLVVRSGRL
jgi:hypothetical protein